MAIVVLRVGFGCETEPEEEDDDDRRQTGAEGADREGGGCRKRRRRKAAKGWLDPRSGRPAVPHGLRSTFRDWAAETGVARDMAEIALAHTVGTEVERACRRCDRLERRRVLMVAWGNACRGERANYVVAFREAV